MVSLCAFTALIHSLCRAKSAAEQAAQKAATAKKERQQVIARLQDQLSAKHAELAGLTTKRAQQEADTASSRAVLVEVRINPKFHI